jgi:hypothetical protein
VSAEEDQWWRRFEQRVRAEAEARGGLCVVQGEGSLRLEPPEGSPGEVVRLSRHDEGYCLLQTGAMVRFVAYFVQFEDINGVLKHVLGVMDGGASETVEISVDGEWIGVRTEILLGQDESVRSQRPLSRQAAGMEAAQTSGRRIRAWMEE